MIGRVIKGIGGFYFVHDGEKAVMGKARGNLKRNKELIYVGDIVDFDIDENDCDNECVINKVVERRNFMTRPPVSNLDMLVVVFSLRDPEVNYPVIDKLLAGCEMKGITPVVCITKKDLVSESELAGAVEIYSDIYPVVTVNGNTGEGLAELRELIKGRSVALAGPSGVGKSTITNHLHADSELADGAFTDTELADEAPEDISRSGDSFAENALGNMSRSGGGLTDNSPEDMPRSGDSFADNALGNMSRSGDSFADNAPGNMSRSGDNFADSARPYRKTAPAQTGTVSDKTGRGRHTTRHVEIFALGGNTYLYDTPGFTSLDMPEMEVAAVRDLFPEMREPAEDCRYRNCLHINEPDCAVKEALDEGRIHRSRYGSYLMMVEEVRNWKKF